MKILIAIVTCHKFTQRADSQRQTWVKDIPPSADVRFFLGRPDSARAANTDEIFLDTDDEYRGLPEKTRAMYRWAIENGYDFVFKADDDSYIVPERLLASGFEKHDYMGRLRGPSGRFPAPYASGFGYWVSAKAMKVLAEAPIEGHDAEDRWVGNSLLAAGIECQPNPWHVVVKSNRNKVCFVEAPRPGNKVIVACEFNPAHMERVHIAWKNREPSGVVPNQIPKGPFSRVSVLIKTFLRDGYLLKTIAAIKQKMPSMKIIVVDDGYASRPKISLYQDLEREGHSYKLLPFDSGFGAKANAGIPYMDREYTLIGSDDFDFAGSGVADGVQRMISVLDARSDVGSAAGHVDDNPYEGFIEYGPDYIRETLLDKAKAPYEETPDGVKYYLVDITVNYNLVRSELLGPGRVRWVENKIGGDHFDFYHDLRQRGAKIAWVPGVDIRQQKHCSQCVHRQYGNYRARAKQAIPGFLRKHNIQRYIAFDGREDRL